MEYPGAKFTKPIRLAVLLLFIAAFFLIAPTVVIYSAGYRFDFRNGLLRETGSLSVDILPKDASVYLDGLKIDEKMPIRLNNISPHKYSLKISAPEYYEWEKQIEIHNNQTTYIKDIVLLRKEKPLLVTNEKAKQLSLSKSGRYLAYLTEDGSLRIRDLLTDSPSKIFSLKDGPYLLRWSPFNDYLAVGSQKAPFKELYVINTEKNHEVTDLITNLNGIMKFGWRNSTEPELYFGDQETINSFLPRTGQKRMISENKYLDWYLQNVLWTLEANTTTNSLEIRKDALGFNDLFKNIYPAEKETTSSLYLWKISQITGQTILLKNDFGHFRIINGDNDFIISADNDLLSQFNNWLILWSPWELWTHSEGEEPFLLSRSGEELIQVEPLDQFNTLALVWKDRVTALYPYYFIERQLVDKEAKSIAADNQNRVLYYALENGIWKLSY